MEKSGLGVIFGAVLSDVVAAKPGGRRRRAGPDLPPFDRVQMGEAQRQARDLWRRRSRGRRGGLSLHGAGKGWLQGLDGAGRGSLRYFAGLPPDRPNPLQGQDVTRRRHVSEAPVAVLQEDADRPWLRS